MLSVVDRDASRLRYALVWADVVRDGIVWDFTLALPSCADILRLCSSWAAVFTHAATSIFRPDRSARIHDQCPESARLRFSLCADGLPVADLLQHDNAGWVDIGGGTTGIAIVNGAGDVGG